ncbi:MAG: hypothetical protein FJZ57_04990 [Chlamydiae bacterium]|nr:hypothetical protein [Chlamydiota bacterium]
MSISSSSNAGSRCNSPTNQIPFTPSFESGVFISPITEKRVTSLNGIVTSSPSATISTAKGGTASAVSIMKNGVVSLISKVANRVLSPGGKIDFDQFENREKREVPDSAISGDGKRLKGSPVIGNPLLLDSGLIETISSKASPKEVGKLACSYYGRMCGGKSHSNITELRQNQIRLEVNDRTCLKKHEEGKNLEAIYIQILIANQIDEELGAPDSYFCLDLEHVVDGAVTSKNGPKGLHVMPVASNICVDRCLKFNRYVTVINWKNEAVSEKSKISSCFSEQIVPASDGSFETSERIQEQLLEIFKSLKETPYVRTSDAGQSFIKKLEMDDQVIYVEALKEATKSHIINTFYPVVFFPISEKRSVGMPIEIASEVSGVILSSCMISSDAFCSIFVEALTVFVDSVSKKGQFFLKTPVRYASRDGSVMVLDGSLGFRNPDLKDVPSYLGSYFHEGFYAEFPRTQIEEWLRTIGSPFSADDLIEFRACKRSPSK